MKRVFLACIAAMLLCSGCIEMLLLACDPDVEDCSFADRAPSPAPLAAPPAEMAR